MPSFAERFLPYWFKEGSKVLEWPILFHDLNKEKYYEQKSRIFKFRITAIS